MRKALTCALLVALFAMSGCGSCCNHDRSHETPRSAQPCEYQEYRCQVPSVVGLNHDAAEAAVIEAGLVPRCIPEHGGICDSQKPPAGVWMNCKEVVEMTFNMEYRKIIKPGATPEAK